MQRRSERRLGDDYGRRTRSSDIESGRLAGAIQQAGALMMERHKEETMYSSTATASSSIARPFDQPHPRAPFGRGTVKVGGRGGVDSVL